MQEDKTLMTQLLQKLSEIEALLTHGASVTVQPPVEGLHVDNPLVIPGYTGKQIDHHLQLLLQRGYISSGGVIGGPMIGIQFSHVTNAGHKFMQSSQT